MHCGCSKEVLSSFVDGSLDPVPLASIPSDAEIADEIRSGWKRAFMRALMY